MSRRATYDWKVIDSFDVEYCSLQTRKVIKLYTIQTFGQVPLPKREVRSKQTRTYMEPLIGDPPENLLEQHDLPQHALEFSPNPGDLKRMLVGVRPGKMAQFLVLKYLVMDGIWVNLQTWDLGSKVLEYMLEVIPSVPFQPIANTKARKRELFGYCLRLLLTETKPGEVPSARLRKAILEALAESGITYQYIIRSWNGMSETYVKQTSKLLIKLHGPGKPPKQQRRRRSSEDSRGIPRASTRRPGERIVALPPTTRRTEPNEKYYVHFGNRIAYYYATLRGEYLVDPTYKQLRP